MLNKNAVEYFGEIKYQKNDFIRFYNGKRLYNLPSKRRFKPLLEEWNL